MFQVVLSRPQWQRLGDAMHVHVSVDAVLVLLKKGKIGEREAIERIREEVAKGNKLWQTLMEEVL